MTDHLRRLGDYISIPIQRDADGFLGRECPKQECEGYFKVVPGTGLQGEGLPCHCPYCGHTASPDHFWTKDQIEYAKSVAMREIMDAVHKDLKKLEFEHKPRGPFGIGISMKLEPGRPVPIHRYREKRLETEVVCGKCTLRYAVYGVFAFCPDCGQHNSPDILSDNMKVVEKMLVLANGPDKELAKRLIENALEDCVSSFDGYGRELCRVHASKATDPAKAERLSFQNLDGARQNVLAAFNVDLATGLTADEWHRAVRSFQRRHLLSHRAGVVDEEYIRKSGDKTVVVGRKITITENEVRDLVGITTKLANYLYGRF